MNPTSLVYTIFSLEGIVFTKKILDERKGTSNKRFEKAKRLVRDHSFISNSIGLIPFPVVDLIGISASQFAMIARLAKLYKVPMKRELLTSFISIITYDLSAIGTYKIAVSLFKSVPFVGSVAGTIATSAHATITTFIMGQLFIQHFEAGGTFLNFDPKTVRTYFREHLSDQEPNEVPVMEHPHQ